METFQENLEHQKRGKGRKRQQTDRIAPRDGLARPPVEGEGEGELGHFCDSARRELRESGARGNFRARGESLCVGVARRARLRGLFASSGDFCTKLASGALFARVFARVARAVIGEGRAMGVESRGCLDTACRRVGSKT